MVHGVHNDASEQIEDYHHTFVNDNDNSIQSDSWRKLSELRFMPNAIFFCTACNIGSDYQLLDGTKTSAIKIISEQFNGKAIGANEQCSAELPPLKDAYRFNSGKYWKVAVNSSYIDDLDFGVSIVSTLSNGSTRQLDNVITTKQIIDMALKEEILQKQ